MTATVRALSTRRRDEMIAASAVLVAALGVATGWPAAAMAAAIVAIPVAGFLLAGHVPGRGAAVGCIAMAVGATLIRPEAGGPPWMALATLAAIGLAAMVAGAQVDGLAAARGLATAEPAGRWVTIVVECDGPADSPCPISRPKVSPHPAPERRSLARLAGDRQRQRGRRPVSVG